MQTSLELIFCAYFTLKYAQLDGGLCSFINISFAVGFAFLILGFPLFTTVFYRLNFEVFKEVKLINKNTEDQTLLRSVYISLRKNKLFGRENSEKLLSLLENGDSNEIVEKLIEADRNGMKVSDKIENINEEKTELIKLLHDLEYIEGK